MIQLKRTAIPANALSLALVGFILVGDRLLKGILCCNG